MVPHIGEKKQNKYYRDFGLIFYSGIFEISII